VANDLVYTQTDCSGEISTQAKPDGCRPVYRAHNQPTRRGWLFLGENGGPCDKACRFCYYAYQPDLVFFTLDTVLMIANRFRHVYHYDYCDISGGEPTIFPKIVQVVEHCANIGLKPTIISHGQNNSEKLVRSIEDAGLEDWLISMHGLADSHDIAVIDRRGQGQGGWQRLNQGLKYITRPTRFNTTLQAFNYRQLPEIARWLVDNRPPTAWNMIQFNPFHAWGDQEVIDFQVPMSQLAPLVGEAVQIAEKAGWEVNVRYFPFCVAAEYGFERNCVGFYQTQFDPWEWGLEASNRMTAAQIRSVGGAEAARQILCDEISRARQNPVCSRCQFRPICEGPTQQYQRRYGLGELHPCPGKLVTDATFFEKPGNHWPDQASAGNTASNSATVILQRLLEAEDLEAALEYNAPFFDDNLLSLIMANAQAARTDSDLELAEGLDSLAAYVQQYL
jgi:sulfatase maturation enzyme AslB (radical SAM superfamily)